MKCSTCEKEKHLQNDTRNLSRGSADVAFIKESRVISGVTGASSAKLSEGMAYHLRTGATIDDPVFRPGSKEFFRLMKEAKALYQEGSYAATAEEKQILESDIGEWAIYQGRKVPLDFPMWSAAKSSFISEAKYKGREVTLGAKGAKRSGGRAHVYVRDPKSGNIRKISFGSSMPDAMGDSEKHKKRRKSFAARHKCGKNKDKMSASYWACRSTKMFGRNVAGWW